MECVFAPSTSTWKIKPTVECPRNFRSMDYIILSDIYKAQNKLNTYTHIINKYIYIFLSMQILIYIYINIAHLSIKHINLYIHIFIFICKCAKQHHNTISVNFPFSCPLSKLPPHSKFRHHCLDQLTIFFGPINSHID